MKDIGPMKSIGSFLSLSRGNQILAIVLVAQILLAGLLLWPRSATVAAGEPLFPGLEPDQVVRVHIIDAEGREVELVKRTGNWVLPAGGDYPAKEGAVPDLLNKLVELKTDRLVTQTRASHARLKVASEDFATRLDVESSGGTVRTLYLGTSPSYSATHVRAAGQDQVYLASGISGTDVGARVTSWVDTLYLSVPQDQVVSVTLENPNGSFEFRKDDADEWAMSGLASDETLNESVVSSLVTRVTSMRMLEPLGKDAQESYGMADPNATIVIGTKAEDGSSKTIVLQVGARTEGDDQGTQATYVVKSSESPYYVRVAEYTAQDWVEKARDSFLQQPPTPAPASTPGS
jgi:hypothetical protein